MVFATLAACDTKVSEDPGIRWTALRVEKDVESARHGDPTYPCAAVRQALVELDKFRSSGVARDAINHGRPACRDLLAAYARERLATAKKSKQILIGECVDIDRAVSLLLAIDPTFAEGAELEKRRKALCQ